MNRSTARQLNRVELLFAQWRDRHPKGKRPPEPLWAEAVALLDHLSPAVVADRLGLNPSRLAARHAAARRPPRAHDQQASPTPRVLELEATQVLPPRELAPLLASPDHPSRPRSTVVEIDRPDGTRLRLALESLEPVALAALCQAFLQTP